MDPITIAVGAFTALKSGINAGKEIHSMGKDLARLWHAIDDVEAEHNKEKKKIFRSVEEEAMDTFLAKQKAKDLEDQLRQIIILTRGVGAWAELVKMRGDIRVKRQEERARLKKEREELIQAIVIIFIVIGVAVTLVLVFGMLYAPHKIKSLLNLAESLYSSFSFLV
jgi:CHASE3 domain sensor protein